MTQPSLAHVNPGDRITADFINELVDAILAIQQELASLGPPSTGNAPVITALLPPDQVPIGAELDVIGRNFGVPANQNVVSLDGVAVTGLLPGSTDTVLKLAVPPISGVPKDAELTVQTATGTALRSVHVVPALTPIPQGHPIISNVTPSLGQIAAGNTYTLVFELDASGVSMTETYGVQASLSNATPATIPASAWTTKLVGTSGSAVTIVPGTPVTLGVQVTVPPGAAGADLSLVLTSFHNDPASSAASTPVPLRVGAAPPQSDSRIHLSIGPIGAAAPFRAAQINGAAGLEVHYPAAGAGGGTLAQVPIRVSYDVAATIQYSITIENPDATLWSAGAANPNNFAYNAGDNAIVHFPLTLLATGPKNETRFLTFTANRTDADAIGQISNFLRFPITGFSA